METLKTVGRWVAVLPAAVVGLFVGSIVSNIFFMLQRFFIGGSPDSFWADFNYYIFSAGIAGAAAVYFGCLTAPSHRKIVGLVLGALVVILSTINILISAGYEIEDPIWNILSAIATAIGAGYVVYYFFEEDKENNNTYNEDIPRY
jgi:hypothetical protein